MTCALSQLGASAGAARYARAISETRAAAENASQHRESENGTSDAKPVHASTLSDPVWLVLAVAVVLVDKQQRVLVARRAAHKPWGGMWEFPGGKVLLAGGGDLHDHDDDGA